MINSFLERAETIFASCYNRPHINSNKEIYMENENNFDSAATQTAYPGPVNPMDKFLGIFAAFGGFMGVIIAYFGGDPNYERSEYLRFYCNQGLVMSLSYLLAVIPFVGWFWTIFTFVCHIIAIINACKGIAKPVLFFGTIRIIK